MTPPVRPEADPWFETWLAGQTVPPVRPDATRTPAPRRPATRPAAVQSAGGRPARPAPQGDTRYLETGRVSQSPIGRGARAAADFAASLATDPFHAGQQTSELLHAGHPLLAAGLAGLTLLPDLGPALGGVARKGAARGAARAVDALVPETIATTTARRLEPSPAALEVRAIVDQLARRPPLPRPTAPRDPLAASVALGEAALDGAVAPELRARMAQRATELAPELRPARALQGPQRPVGTSEAVADTPHQPVNPEMVAEYEAIQTRLRNRGGFAGDGAARGVDSGSPMRRKAPFDWSPSSGSREARLGDTRITYGVGRDNTAELIHVETPRTKRGQGRARAAIETFLREADERGRTVKLYASPRDAQTDAARLAQFYESLGFARTGRTIEHSGAPEMVRTPQSAPAAAGGLFDGVPLGDDATTY